LRVLVLPFTLICDNEAKQFAQKYKLEIGRTAWIVIKRYSRTIP